MKLRRILHLRFAMFDHVFEQLLFKGPQLLCQQKNTVHTKRFFFKPRNLAVTLRPQNHEK